MEPAEFKEHQEFKHLLEEHIKRRDRRPEHGEYENPFGPEEKIKGPDFSKGLPDLFDLTQDEDIEGDILILDPMKLGKRLPNIKFEKMLGR